MSGSYELKTERKTGVASQPSAWRTQGSSEFVVAELLELAALATAAGAKPGLALARFVTELLHKREDSTIGQAIESAPSFAIAHVLRQAVETASEQVVIYHNGSTMELSLFAIPIITAFDEDVPASQFEAALSGLNAPKTLTYIAGEGPWDLRLIVLLPELFRLEELQAVAPSLVRRLCVSLGTAGVTRAVTPHPLVRQTASYKRSTAFLRYLIGQRRLSQRHRGLDEAQLCAALQDRTKQAIARYLGLACQVQACMGSFHDALYSGMWRYQEKRLDQLGRESRAQTPRENTVEARVVVSRGQAHTFELRVEFFAGTEPIRGRAYRLSARPGEAASECVTRITRRLAAAGVRTKAVTEFISDEPGFGMRRRRNVAPMIRIPI